MDLHGFYYDWGIFRGQLMIFLMPDASNDCRLLMIFGSKVAQSFHHFLTALQHIPAPFLNCHWKTSIPVTTPSAARMKAETESPSRNCAPLAVCPHVGICWDGSTMFHRQFMIVQRHMLALPQTVCSFYGKCQRPAFPTQHSTVFTVFTLHSLHSTPFHSPHFYTGIVRQHGKNYKTVEIACFPKVFYVTAFWFVGFSCFS